jgi:hypothetical protein
MKKEEMIVAGVIVALIVIIIIVLLVVTKQAGQPTITAGTGTPANVNYLSVYYLQNNAGGYLTMSGTGDLSITTTKSTRWFIRKNDGSTDTSDTTVPIYFVGGYIFKSYPQTLMIGNTTKFAKTSSSKPTAVSGSQAIPFVLNTSENNAYNNGAGKNATGTMQTNTPYTFSGYFTFGLAKSGSSAVWVDAKMSNSDRSDKDYWKMIAAPL